MKVKIRTKGLHMFIPLPSAMIGFAVRFIPESVFERLRLNTPKPYCDFITKETCSMILRECLDMLKENKGLEIIHVEASDGTFVSVKL
ncbi:hypothetical protein [Anaerostipes sp.]|uniref:hypothetical protein n=1 Tax=Anaerostipes sp. TaxID=1872530 RepID=UPI0025BEA082|nr:hypothetical protein [Anaerostipes sp.]MBS7008082.1 hypothetical protein [Anaerostipes sp.]